MDAQRLETFKNYYKDCVLGTVKGDVFELIAEIERLKADIKELTELNIRWKNECVKAADNIERLKAENEQLNQHQDECAEEASQQEKEIERLKAENSKLKERLEDVYLKDTGKTREINILTKENNQQRKALEPFRRFAQGFKTNGNHEIIYSDKTYGNEISVGDLRRAEEALKQSPSPNSTP